MWKPKKSRRPRCRQSHMCQPSGHMPQCQLLLARIEQFERLLDDEQAHLQSHVRELTDLQANVRDDCQCSDKFEKKLKGLEKRVLKLRCEMQVVHQQLVDTDNILQVHQEKQNELYHRLQGLWTVMTETCTLPVTEVQPGIE